MQHLLGVLLKIHIQDKGVDKKAESKRQTGMVRQGEREGEKKMVLRHANQVVLIVGWLRVRFRLHKPPSFWNI